MRAIRLGHADTVSLATDPGWSARRHVVPIPELSGADAAVVAERLRDLPGLAVLESARAGRRARWSYVAADPVAVAAEPGPRGATFAPARSLLERMGAADGDDRRTIADGDDRHVAAVIGSPSGFAADVSVGRPPFTGGLIGYLSYDLGRELERLPSLAVDDQGLPLLRLALHDWVVALDRVTGEVVLAGRVVDGDATRLRRRLADIRGRLTNGRPGGVSAGRWGAGSSVPDSAGRPGGAGRAVADAAPPTLRFASGLDRPMFESRVRAIQDAIAAGELYQANLARRLAASFDGDPWPLFRRLRAGDPALFAAYIDLGVRPATGARRAIVSASPEPFLAVGAAGRVATDPIKGTRPRGQSRDEDRALARELLASEKDRAENVMIVDVLRNDLGRSCRPGTVRVPRLCRLERTAAVQHLVSTVTGELAPGRDALDLLAGAFPGGSVTGAPKIRAIELIEALEPVRRGPYTGAALWIGPDGAMGSSILIRTFVADGRRVTLHVGGGITRRSDPAAEWDETVAKAAGPLRAIGATEE